MAQRGRPPKDKTIRKSEPVSIRLTPYLRDRLEAERTSADPQRTLSQEIELRLRESFDFDKAIQKLLGGNDYHCALLRFVAEVIVIIEVQTGLHFVRDRFTFDHVKAAINTILDRFKPSTRSSLPDRLSVLKELAGEQAVKELGKRLALLMLVPIELGLKHREDLLITLPDFQDPIVSSRHLSALMRKPVIEELNEIWRREQKSVIERQLAASKKARDAGRPTIPPPAMRTTRTKPRRSKK